jgi:hypothetical protein
MLDDASEKVHFKLDTFQALLSPFSPLDTLLSERFYRLNSMFPPSNKPFSRALPCPSSLQWPPLAGSLRQHLVPP